jgi:ActR/RegA family two-component response regulator
MSQPDQKRALLVHSDMGILSNLQNALTREGFITIVARDLSSALLAITQHQFQLAAVGADLGEPGTGWPLAGVLRLAFPKAFVCVLDQKEAEVAGIRSAINYGVQRIYVQSRPAEQIVATLLADAERSIKI